MPTVLNRKEGGVFNFVKEICFQLGFLLVQTVGVFFKTIVFLYFSQALQKSLIFEKTLTVRDKDKSVFPPFGF